MPAKRAARRRTRWLSFVPHALTFTGGSDTWDSQVMEIEDALGTVSMFDLVGATIVRTLVDITVDHSTLNFGGADDHGSIYMHVGFGLDDAAAPLQNRWDPNKPHAEFMWRGSQYGFWDYSVESAGITQSYRGDPLVFHADSSQRRRITEADQMWLFGHVFHTSDFGTGVTCGYTGRILVALP